MNEVLIMKVNLVIVKSAVDHVRVTDDKKPYYLLVADTVNPQLIYLSKNNPPHSIAFNQYDFNRFKFKTGLGHAVDLFLSREQTVAITTLKAAQKKAITEVTGHKPPCYSQALLIANINDYLQENKYTIKANEHGVCQGLAAIYCKYATQKNEKKFFELLAKIATQTKGAQKNDLEVNRFIQEVIIAFNPQIFDKNSGQSYSLENITVANPDKSDKSSLHASLRSKFKFQAQTTAKQWAPIFHDVKFEGGSYLLGIKGHALAMKYENRQFHLYDPNYEEGVKTFSSEQEMLNEIATTITAFKIQEAREQAGVTIKLPVVNGSVELKYENNKYYLYNIEDRPSPKIFDNESSLEEYINNSIINNKKLMMDITIDIVENPYFPIRDFEFPDKKALLHTLQQAKKEFSLPETIVRSIAENDNELADELLNSLIDPTDVYTGVFFAVAFVNNAHEWLIKLLNHPKISRSEKIRTDLIDWLTKSPQYFENDRSLRIFLEHPAFTGMRIDVAVKAAWLYHAVSSKNSESVEIVLRRCTEEELEEIINEELIYQAVNQGRIDTLNVLFTRNAFLMRQIMTPELSQTCVLAALKNGDFRMALHLIEKNPLHHLDKTLHLMPFTLDEKRKFMDKALVTRMEPYIKLVVALFPKPDLQRGLTDELIYEAVRLGHVPSLALLCSKRTLDATVVRKCLAEAASMNNLVMIDYLTSTFPQHNLAASFAISAALIREYKINLPTLLSLREKGAVFIASKVNNVTFSPEDAEVALKIYEYVSEPTTLNLTLFRPNLILAPSANSVDFVIDLISEEKINEMKVFQDIIANNDILFGLALVREMHARWSIHPSTCEAMNYFMEHLIVQKRNDTLKNILDLVPQLPLDYRKLHAIALAEETSYKASWWPTMTYTAIPDPLVLETLGKRVEPAAPEPLGSTPMMLRIQSNIPAETSTKVDSHDLDGFLLVTRPLFGKAKPELTDVVDRDSALEPDSEGDSPTRT